MDFPDFAEPLVEVLRMKVHFSHVVLMLISSMARHINVVYSLPFPVSECFL
jgi:hypothetical protein